MDHDQLNFDLRHAPSLKLLRRDTAALIISFLHRAFKRAQLASIPLAELTAGLDTYLEQLSEAHPGQYPLSAAAYLKLWSSEEYQLLRITTRGSEEPAVELTAEAERAIGWVEERYRRSFVSTESRLRSIVLLLEEIVAKSTEDVPTRLQQLEAQRAAIQAEIDSIRATGQVSPTTSTSVKERFLLASDLARQMRRDFAEVEQNFRAVARALQERQLDPAARRGDLVGFMLDADAELRESDQGRSFYAFWEFLMAPARQDELTTLLETIYRLPVLADLTPDHQLLRRLTRALTDAGEKVVLSNHRLAEQVRRLLDDRRLAESRRAAELIAAVKQLAVRCAERPPKDDPFIELDGPPELQFVMDRPLWESRAEVRLDFEPLEPGVVAPDDLDLSLLYQQFSVDEGLLRRQVETLLDSQPSCTLGEVLERYPAQQGLAEIIAYLAIAAGDTRHLIDPTTRDAILLRAGDATPMRLLHVPRVTFRGGYAR